MYGNERGASPGRPSLRRLMAGNLSGASAAKRRAVEVKGKPERGRWKRQPAVAALGSKVRVVAKPNLPKLPTGRSDSNKKESSFPTMHSAASQICFQIKSCQSGLMKNPTVKWPAGRRLTTF